MSTPLPIAGREVTRVCIDFALTIEFWSQDLTATIRAEGPVFLRVGTTGVQTFQPEPSDEINLPNPLGWHVVTAEVREDGTLFVEFTDDKLLWIPPSPPYEAWEYHDSNELRLFCRPSGGYW